jgi:uncharacterized protein
MNPTLDMIAAHMLRVTPAFALAALVIYFTRQHARLRIVVYLAMFVLLRDTMTRPDMWSFGSQGFFWIRLSSDPWFLIAAGISCLAASVGLYYLDRDNQPLFRWVRGNLALGLLWGLGGVLVIIAPFAISYQYTPIEARGGTVPLQLLPAVLCFAILGNLFEEALFRGYVFGFLAEQATPIRAGLVSGIVFAFCHIFLAISVTNVGYPLLVFTLWEGVITGMVGAKGGVIPATLTHGGTIFLLSSGLL